MLTNLTLPIKFLSLIFLGLLLTACPSLETKPSPPQMDRLTGLDASNININQTKISNASKNKLAIIYSVNVKPQLEANAAMAAQMKPLITYYVKDSNAVNADANIVFSGEAYLQTIINSLTSKFKDAIYAKNLNDAFANGANYVAIVDLRLEYLDLSSKLVPGPLISQFVADISTLFIDKNRQAGPDVQIKNTTVLQEEPKGAEANTRQFLKNIKDVRIKSLKAYDAELNKVISE